MFIVILLIHTHGCTHTHITTDVSKIRRERLDPASAIELLPKCDPGLLNVIIKTGTTLRGSDQALYYFGLLDNPGTDENIVMLLCC